MGKTTKTSANVVTVDRVSSGQRAMRNLPAKGRTLPHGPPTPPANTDPLVEGFWPFSRSRHDRFRELRPNRLQTILS
jgi:hypothetical protein